VAITLVCGIWRLRLFRCSGHIQSLPLLIYFPLPDFWRELRANRRFQSFEMGVHVGVFKLLVAKYTLDEFDVLGSVEFHGCFPMSECVQVNLSQFRILEG
jgi:hypothetical protein